MADYDEKSRSAHVVCVAPASRTSTPSATSVDLLGFGACTFEVFAGAGGITFDGDNRIDFTVEDSADDATWSVVDDDFLILAPGATAPGDTGIVRSLIAAHASADTTIPTVGYRGKKRYARCRPVFVGTHGSGTLVAVFARKGHVISAPVGASSIEV